MTEEKTTMNRVERKKEETKQKIIKVAIELFIKQGVDAITMEQIAREVDIAKGTLYNYFPVKEAIINEFIQEAFKKENPKTLLELEALPDTRTRMTVIMRMLIGGVSQYKDIFEKFMVYNLQRLMSLELDKTSRAGFANLGEFITKLGQKNGEIRNDIPVDLIMNLFEFVFIEVVRQYFRSPDTFDHSAVIDQCVELFINGVKK
ncbi:MAG: TetR/AcrR family transcriptional regulator [Bacillota bacterium]|nr:TetR/AcrR family transcriptional regulator [Bacillota bacterium]